MAIKLTEHFFKSSDATSLDRDVAGEVGYNSAVGGIDPSEALSLTEMFSNGNLMEGMIVGFNSRLQGIAPTAAQPAQQQNPQLATTLQGQSPKDVTALHATMAPDIKVVTAPQANVAAKGIQQTHDDVNQNVESLQQGIAKTKEIAQKMDAKNAGADQPAANSGGNPVVNFARDAAITFVAGAVGGPVAATAVGLGLQVASLAGGGTLETHDKPMSSTPTYVSKAEAKKMDTGYSVSASAPSPVPYGPQASARPAPVFSPDKTPLDSGRVQLASEGINSISRCVCNSEQMKTMEENLTHYKIIKMQLDARQDRGVPLNAQNIGLVAQISSESASDSLRKAIDGGGPRNIMGV